MATEESTSMAETGTNRNVTLTVSSKALFIGFTLALLLVTIFLLVAFKKYNTNEKEFLFTSCTSCKKDGCKEDKSSTGFKVTQTNILIFHTSDGMERILTLPYDGDTKCTILKEKNFAFDCSTLSTLESVVHSGSVVFDGKNKFEMTNDTLMGDRRIQSRKTCLVVEK